MHQSIFSYNLTRPYPYPWFTWLVILGGIIATAIFTAINIAANGYIITTEYVADLNQTESLDSIAWYQTAPWSLVSKVKTSCQDQVLEVESQFYTNNTRLKYEVTAIATFDQQRRVPKTSIIYRNDILHDCILWRIFMDRQTYSQSFSSISADVNCTLYEPDSQVPTIITISFLYQSTSAKPSPFDEYSLYTIDRQNTSAFWWGIALLHNFEQGMGIDFEAYPSEARIIHHDNFTGSSIRIESSNPTTGFPMYSSTRVQEINSLTYNSLIRSEEEWDSPTDNNTFADQSSDVLLGNTELAKMIVPLSFSWTSTAKMFSSFMLTDLGQSIRLNLLADGDRLFDFMNKTQSFYLLSEVLYGNGIAAFYPFTLPNQYNYTDWQVLSNISNSQKFYSATKTGIPQVHPAVINTQYLCQIPKQKPLGPLMVSVIVADLVFLQATWSIFTLIAKYIMERRDPEVNCCYKCAQEMRDDHSSMLGGRPVSTNNHRQTVPRRTFKQTFKTALLRTKKRSSEKSPKSVASENDDTVSNLLSENGWTFREVVTPVAGLEDPEDERNGRNSS